MYGKVLEVVTGASAIQVVLLDHYRGRDGAC